MTSLFNSRLFCVIRRACQLFAVMALLAIWFTVPSGSASAASKPPSKAKIVNASTSFFQNQHAPYRCLDADLNTMANNGTKVQLWDCNGSAQQFWN